MSEIDLPRFSDLLEMSSLDTSQNIISGGRPMLIEMPTFATIEGLLIAVVRTEMALCINLNPLAGHKASRGDLGTIS